MFIMMLLKFISLKTCHVNSGFVVDVLARKCFRYLLDGYFAELIMFFYNKTGCLLTQYAKFMYTYCFMRLAKFLIRAVKIFFKKLFALLFMLT